MEKVEGCYGLDVCVPPNSCVEILTPNVMELGGGAFGGKTVMSGIRALIRKPLLEPILLFFF